MMEVMKNRWIGLPVFGLWLGAQVAWSLTRMLGEYLLGLRSLWLSLMWLGFLGFFLLNNTANPLFQAKTNYLTHAEFPEYQELLRVVAQKNEAFAKTVVQQGAHHWSSSQQEALLAAVEQNSVLKKEVQYWENILQLQPTSREVLLNMSQLYAWQDQKEKASVFQKQAHALDPNP